MDRSIPPHPANLGIETEDGTPIRRPTPAELVTQVIRSHYTPGTGLFEIAERGSCGGVSAGEFCDWLYQAYNAAAHKLSLTPGDVVRVAKGGELKPSRPGAVAGLWRARKRLQLLLDRALRQRDRIPRRAAPGSLGVERIANARPLREEEGGAAMAREARMSPHATIPKGATPNPQRESLAEILRRVQARHEAAHAVVAHMFGLRVEEMALDSHNRKITANPCGGGETYAAAATWRENTLVALAGGVESRRQLEHPFGGRTQQQDEPNPFPSSDEKAVALCLRHECDRDPEKVKALFKARYEEARVLVEKHDSQIGALAEALLDSDGFLVEAQILQVLGPYPEVSSETLRERERAYSVLQGDPEWDEIL